jgi:hypothetical protein
VNTKVSIKVRPVSMLAACRRPPDQSRLRAGGSKNRPGMYKVASGTVNYARALPPKAPAQLGKADQEQRMGLRRVRTGGQLMDNNRK